MRKCNSLGESIGVLVAWECVRVISVAVEWESMTVICDGRVTLLVSVRLFTTFLRSKDRS